MFFIVHLVKGKDGVSSAATAAAATKGRKGKKGGGGGGGDKPGLKWPKLKACIYKRR